jgi:hypothetical protein
MTGKIKLGVVILIMVVVIAAAAVTWGVLHRINKPISLMGSIVKQDTDPRKQSPITDVTVSVPGNLALASVKSDFSGYFKLELRPSLKRGQPITLQFRHKDYKPLDLNTTLDRKLYVIRMVALHQEPTAAAPSNRPLIPLSNVFVRYSTESTTSDNIGTGLRTFQVANTGNTPCNNRAPCSPDGRWKGAIASTSLDAGVGNTYDDARLSCIAGPCPFTRIVSDNFSHGGRYISVSILNWSDTTTFLLQAEVFRIQISNIVRESYPVIFGNSLNFTLPASAEGPSLEAEESGQNIVFPLGPSPQLSWADCNVRVGKDQSKSYRCELKPGYQFR